MDDSGNIEDVSIPRTGMHSDRNSMKIAEKMSRNVSIPPNKVKTAELTCWHKKSVHR